MSTHWIFITKAAYVAILCKAVIHSNKSLKEFGIQVLTRQQVEYNEYIPAFDIPLNVKQDFLHNAKEDALLCHICDPYKFVIAKLKHNIVV